MAEVFRAESQPIAGVTRRVAIKRLLHSSETNPDLVHSLIDEARIWVRLQHPNIVQVLEFGEHQGSLFLALELIEGLSAADLLRRNGPLPVDQALCLVERLARALDYAHTLEEDGRPLRIVHRDVKLGNILLSLRGEVKLTDFGIARATDRITRTRAGQIKGTVSTMAPEQVRGEDLDGRADIFALGCVLHSLLTGRSLFPESTPMAIVDLAEGRIPPPPDHLAANVRRLLARMLAFRPADRHPRGEEVGREIRTILLPTSPDDIERALGERVKTCRDGSQREALDTFPEPSLRSPEQRLAAAAIHFASGEFGLSEAAALDLAAAPGLKDPDAVRCLAAAAALNRDLPGRADSHLRGVSGQCARLLRAASHLQRGNPDRAKDFLRGPVTDARLRPAYESAHGVLLLLEGNIEGAAASALSATSATSNDPLSPGPWILHTIPSPRGANARALRVSGPFSDPVLYTRILEGDAAAARGNLDLAIKHYDGAIARSGHIAIAEVRAARVLARQGRPQLARGRLMRALAADPHHAPAMVAFALLEEAAFPERAAAHARAALEIEPDNADARRIARRSGSSP